MPEKKSVSQDEKIWGALSYFWIFSIIALALKKNNSFIKFHANQGVLLFLLSFVVIIPMLGWLVLLLICILAIIALIKAYNGEKWELPILSGVAQELGDWLIKTLKL
jgi:uncharacterized membrane protein